MQECMGSTNQTWSVKRRKEKRTQVRRAGKEVDLEGTQQGIKHDQNMFYETLNLKNTQTHHIFQLCPNNAIYFLMYVFSRYLYGFQGELFRICGKTYIWFSAYVQREGKRKLDNFLPPVSKMHQNWTTMYVTWSLYSLWHNSGLLLSSKLSLCKTTLLGGGQLRSVAVEALGHRKCQHSPVFRWGFQAGKAVMEKLTLNIPKILEYLPKWLPKTAPVNFKTIQQPSPSEKFLYDLGTWELNLLHYLLSRKWEIVPIPVLNGQSTIRRPLATVLSSARLQRGQVLRAQGSKKKTCIRLNSMAIAFCFLVSDFIWILRY